MDDTAAAVDATIGRELARHGRMNFDQRAWVNGSVARLAMDSSRVYLAMGDAGVRVVSDLFHNVASNGVESHRSVGIGGHLYSVDFDNAGDAERWDRVLGVRQSAGAARATTWADRPAGGRTVGLANPMSPGSAYERYAGYVMSTSVMLLALGWFNMAGGVVLAIIGVANHSAQAGLLGLILAAAGSAMPLCLGSLARMIVYRYRMQDRST